MEMNRLSILLSLFLCSAAASIHAESLYNESTYRPLTSDNKAFRVGDVLTVQVFENSSASTTTDTTSRRNNGLSANASLFNRIPLSLSLSNSGTFDGGGQTQRTNKFLTTLTVSVVEVMQNGDLRLSGEQLLTVNGEQQKVLLTGRARPYDISDTNVVASTRLADAKITYVGEGDLTDRQKLSWWRKLVDWIGF